MPLLLIFIIVLLVIAVGGYVMRHEVEHTRADVFVSRFGLKTWNAFSMSEHSRVIQLTVIILAFCLLVAFYLVQTTGSYTAVYVVMAAILLTLMYRSIRVGYLIKHEERELREPDLH